MKETPTELEMTMVEPTPITNAKAKRKTATPVPADDLNQKVKELTAMNNELSTALERMTSGAKHYFEDNKKLSTDLKQMRIILRITADALQNAIHMIKVFGTALEGQQND